MLIKKHDKSDIVELDDGSLWRIWPGDIALTLNWRPTTDLLVSDIGDEFCSHALIDQADGSRVRVIEASEDSRTHCASLRLQRRKRSLPRRYRKRRRSPRRVGAYYTG